MLEGMWGNEWIGGRKPEGVLEELVEGMRCASGDVG